MVRSLSVRLHGPRHVKLLGLITGVVTKYCPGFDHSVYIRFPCKGGEILKLLMTALLPTCLSQFLEIFSEEKGTLSNEK
jgi:hypothetical protein